MSNFFSGKFFSDTTMFRSVFPRPVPLAEEDTRSALISEKKQARPVTSPFPNDKDPETWKWMRQLRYRSTISVVPLATKADRFPAIRRGGENTRPHLTKVCLSRRSCFSSFLHNSSLCDCAIHLYISQSTERTTFRIRLVNFVARV